MKIKEKKLKEQNKQAFLTPLENDSLIKSIIPAKDYHEKK